ncbi:hypothetical protein [Paenibacillus amylolyticus]|uniref:hypothetical protein n=1 Tax=Paenibacillus amylolyticus TaxID=1451 RepID=UPI003EC0C18A
MPGRTTDHLDEPNSLHHAPADACGANATKTHQHIKNASRTLQERLKNIVKIYSNDYSGAYLSNIHPFEILTITTDLILLKTQVKRPFSHQNPEISSPEIVRKIKPSIWPK